MVEILDKWGLEMEMYYIIKNSDGDTTIEGVTKKELLERIDPKDPYYGHTNFLEEIKEGDTNYWGDNILIIKGSIVSPTPVKVVEKFEVE